MRRYWLISLALVSLPAASADWVAEVVAREQTRYQQQYGYRDIPRPLKPFLVPRRSIPVPRTTRPAKRGQELSGSEIQGVGQQISQSPSASRPDYRPLIRHYALQNRLPARLVRAMIQAESGHNASAVSPKGAQGLMQLMPGTARRFGVSNPWDPAQNIAGGTRYLSWLLDTFDNDLKLALAGYNAGEGTVRRYGHTVPPYRETQRYVRRVLDLYTTVEFHRH